MKLLSRLPYIMFLGFLLLAVIVPIHYKRPAVKPYKYKADLAEIAESVVPYKSVLHDYRRMATGFHIEFYGNTYIVTNKHVCQHPGVKGNKIVFGESLGTIIAIDTKHDLCVVSSKRMKGLKLAEKTPLNFQPIYLIGYPRGIGKVIRKGHVIEAKQIFAPWLKMDYNWVDTYHISTIAYGGNSGSPVVNEYGEVVGVLFAGRPGIETDGYMVPLKDLKSFLYEALLNVGR